jgi:hypothetical protein
MALGSNARGSPRVVNIEDLRCLARRRLPRSVFDYLDGGAEEEITLRENSRAFHHITFRPCNAVAVGGCDLTVRVLGYDLSFPAMLAPVGYSRLLIPPNLTPDLETGLGAWSDADIIRAIRMGVARDGRQLDDTMPSLTAFHDMTDQDATDVVRFLRSLRPVRSDWSANQ